MKRPPHLELRRNWRGIWLYRVCLIAPNGEMQMVSETYARRFNGQRAAIRLSEVTGFRWEDAT